MRALTFVIISLMLGGLPPFDIDCHLTLPLVDHGRCNIRKNITRQAAGLALGAVTVARRSGRY
jgi:hypothetical protein